ncbi:MAG: PAS domain-containing protein [Gemmatimonadales bacterium]|nr:PAS domain-containing protein [Gemmatimonadales bacterium]
MGALIRAFDWGSTALGPVSEWPQSLRTAVGVLLSTRHPMFIWWGPDLVQFYNDAYRRSLGPDRHPNALGQGGRACWAEIWPLIGPEIEAVMGGGEATWHEDRLVPITRGDRVEDVYWSYSYSPILDDDGDVGGVLVTVQETTKRVLTERRARILQELAANELEAESEQEVIAIAISTLEAESGEVGFALLYVHDPAMGVYRLADSAGLAAGHPAGPPTLDHSGAGVWPVPPATSDQLPVVVEDLITTVGSIRREGWPEAIREALMVPMARSGGDAGLNGWLIVGVNPRLRVDEEYRRFFSQIAREITHALHNVHAVEQERRGRQAAEVAAAERDAERLQLARVFELSPTFLTVLRGPDHVVELSNAAYHRLIGVREILGKPVRSALPEVEGQGFFELLDRVYRTGEPFVGNELAIQVERAPAEGLETRYVNFVYQPMRGADGAVTGILASGTDVTDFVQSREAAERLAGERDIERRQLLTVLEQAPLAIVLADAPSGRITFANPRVWKIFGRADVSTPPGVPGEHWRGVHPDGLAIEPEEWPLSRAIRLGETVANETVLIETPGGQRAELVINAAPVRDAQGNIIAGVAMFWDVTAERRTERQLRDAERLQSVGTLAGGVAHEVNNQMTTVLGFGEFILRALGPEHPQAADLRVVLTAADRTARITNQLLTFSRKQMTQPRVVDLRALTLGLRPVLQQLLGTDKDLVIEAGRDTCSVAADPTQVEQVLINLVANARDATETGGRVTIGFEDVELTDSDMQGHDFPITPGSYVLLTVSDTGHGMDAPTLARVFEPFFTTKNVGEGTGLGLSMVYGIVKRHGGHVWAESAPGRGTVLKLYWPSARQGAGSSGEISGGGWELPRPPGSRRASILVVEDERSVRELARRILKEEGYQVLAAEDGQDALRVLSESGEKPSLVLTDVLMPRMNGRQLSETLRELYPGVPILFMSGDIGENVVWRQLMADGAPFVRKPFTPAQLLKGVSGVLR